MNLRLGILAASVAIGTSAISAHAQVVSTPVQPASAGWTFNVTPYIWLPTIRADLNFHTPSGSTVTESINAGINDYISNINFGMMGGAEARDGRFSLITDLIYISLSFKNDFSVARLGLLRTPQGDLTVPRSSQLSLGSRYNATIGSMGGGYTLVDGAWGNVDAIAGLRILGTGGYLNYQLDHDILLPNQTVGLSRTGSLNMGSTFVEGFGGVRGRFTIPNSRFYVPWYLDAGGGDIPFTWQAYLGLGYAAGFANLSLGYRWLDFQSRTGASALKNISLGGAVLAAAFRF